MAQCRQHRSKLRGVVAVEFALVLVPLLILVTGVAEYGRAIYQYNALTKATRDAARFLSQYAPSEPNYPVDQAKCIAVYGKTTCGGAALVNGLSPSMVVVCDRIDSTGCGSKQFANVAIYEGGDSSRPPAGTINLVEVKISGFTYSPIQSYLNVGALAFSDIATVMRQVL
ncbi:Flp pilus assembly protein TadG, includes N-terminal TadE domain [Cupriavidus necator]|uniref:Pilus assembly protein n=1 Tax=Cupriavidus necator (strain ATCC 17699 / DSM 428 / KCTC 22496 / NCIMB 10442 / H16 / Stanier 337) TaxID=381666 RepID=Q0KDQ9_CUPNH|nr:MULTISPECIES: TadE/TadG family type IV pilus assembly protein [Cupriavidus]EON17905.1 flp pilus assembly protein TadG [Cupriavidus sp. GA3-3]KUE89438.1 pilus assembly protein TadG [Cupriavidus necator]QCB99791.1 pilus assembly protein [Cupriavidus necator H16]QQB77392.1 pilus assembly protein [Cupriavidus necator]WKA41633.1 TadE/TadG family type IV pilus assembly protein [Cupriavidus necator]